MLQAAATPSTTALTVADIDTTVNCEPRVLDTKLGKGLGMARPTNIRSQIEANRAELETFGSLHAARAMIKTGKGAKREVVSYYLTEGQALCICALSRAPNAPQVRRALIEAFMELRRRQIGAPAEKPTPVRAHRRRSATPGPVPKSTLETYASWLLCERAAVLAELYPDRPPGHRTGLIVTNPGAFYHLAKADVILPAPSTRAEAVLRTVGCAIPALRVKRIAGPER